MSNAPNGVSRHVLLLQTGHVRGMSMTWASVVSWADIWVMIGGDAELMVVVSADIPGSNLGGGRNILDAKGESGHVCPMIKAPLPPLSSSSTL